MKFLWIFEESMYLVTKLSDVTKLPNLTVYWDLVFTLRYSPSEFNNTQYNNLNIELKYKLPVLYLPLSEPGDTASNFKRILSSEK